MSTFQSKGIVFRNIKYGETSMICDIFTEEKGLRSYIVSGIRSGKTAGKWNIYRPLNLVNMFAYDNEGTKLARIKEIHYSHIYQRVHFQVIRSSIALFMLEIARNAIRSTDSDVELFRFLESSFVDIDTADHVHALAPVIFMLRFSAWLGFEPMKNYKGETQVFDLLNGQFSESEQASAYVIPTERANFFYQLLCLSQDDHLPEIPKATRLSLLDDMIVYYKLHISGFKDILSKDVLAGVL